MRSMKPTLMIFCHVSFSTHNMLGVNKELKLKINISSWKVCPEKLERLGLACSSKIKVALPKRWSRHYSLAKILIHEEKIQAINNKYFVPRREEYEVLFCWARRENIGINCTCDSWHLIGWAKQLVWQGSHAGSDPWKEVSWFHYL